MCFNVSSCSSNYNNLPIADEIDVSNQFLQLKEIHQKTILHIYDLHSIVTEYLKPVTSNMTIMDWRVHIILDNIENKSLLNWPLEKFQACFLAAIIGVNDNKEDENSDLPILSILLQVAQFKKLDMNTIFCDEYMFDGEYFKVNFLHFASVRRKYAALQYMLESNLFDVNFRTCTLSFFKKYDKTPLHIATLNGNALAINLLLNVKDIETGISDIGGWKPFNGLLNTYCYDKVKYSECVESFKKLLTEDTFLKMCDGFTLLKACELSLDDLAICLIKSPYLAKEVNYQQYSYGTTPLFSSVRHHLNPSIIQALLQHPNIDVNMRSSFRASRLTPLHLAILINNMPAFKLLLAHPQTDINKKESSVYLFDKKKFNPFRFDVTPLFTAVRLNNVEAVKLLLTKQPKMTPSIFIQQHKESVEAKFGGEIITTKTTEDISPFEMARQNGNIEILNLLIEAYQKQSWLAPFFQPH